MFKRILIPMALILTAFVVFGCSNGTDDPTEPQQQADLTAGQISGEIKQDEAAFEFFTEAPAAPGDPVPGRLLIRGANLRYDDDLGALLVDLTLVNATPRDFPEPVSLTFVSLIPDSVTVLNADNGETGPGAVFDFEFENDDAMWTAGEQSLPRTVQFNVAAGMSIGFVSRVMMGDPGLGGTIGGMVWEDLNGNGIRDDDEMGVPRVHIALFTGTEPDSSYAPMVAVTDTAGQYGFQGLPAGYYTVALVPHDHLEPTTAPMIQVLLVENDGEIADFLMADFGVLFTPPTDGGIMVGDCINAKGMYRPDPDRLEAEIIDCCDEDKSGDPDLGDSGGGGDCEGGDCGGEDGSGDCDDCDDDDCDCDCDEDCDCDCDCDETSDCWGRLSGPITDIDLENHAVAIMGTWVHFPDWDRSEDDPVVIGMRVRANVRVESTDEGDHIIGCRLHLWNGNRDRVRGYVQEVIEDDQGGVRAVRVLNTLITH